MKSFEQWLSEYGESHKNSTNKAIHWICIPLIMFSIIGVLWIIPVPAGIREATSGWVNWGSFFVALTLLFYLRLSISIFIGFVFVAALMIIGNYYLFALGWLEHFIISLAIFVLAWIGQFVGHKIEGKKPSFFQDLQFLLIGPAWLMHFIFKKTGIPY